MTTELTPFRQQSSGKPKTAHTRPETARRDTIATRIVPMKTLYLELSVRRSLFDDESRTGQPERHPEWYIG
jgi:hypothetical protein